VIGNVKYLLDTNVVSEPLRPTPSKRIVRLLRKHQFEVAIASVVWHELRFGVERLPVSRRRLTLEHYLADVVLATMPILEYDRAAAEWHALERARLIGRGQTPPFTDGQIAAVAHVHQLTLVTFNDADFRRFQGVRVVTWR
jgi:tRNA(fMet)-specific endonuclease VapC